MEYSEKEENEMMRMRRSGDMGYFLFFIAADSILPPLSEWNIRKREENEMEYSEKEEKLLRHFGFGDYFFSSNSSVVAPSLYRMAVEEAFISGESGCYVNSLRRTAKALRDCRPYRLTSEFEALIQLEDSLDE